MKVQNIRLKMIREDIGDYKANKTKIGSPEDVCDVIERLFELKTETVENFGALFLDHKNHLVGADILTRGTVSSSLISTRDLIQKALMVNANRMIVFHNHPSGDPEPSPQDIQATEKIVKACEVMDMTLLDHVIVGRTNASLNSLGVIR